MASGDMAKSLRIRYLALVSVEDITSPLGFEGTSVTGSQQRNWIRILLGRWPQGEPFVLRTIHVNYLMHAVFVDTGEERPRLVD